MCFWRTLASALFLTAWVWFTERDEFLATLKTPTSFLPMGVLYISGLLAFTAGTFETTATVSMLITRAVPIFTIVLSACFFADERRLIRRKDFVVGLIVACAALAGLCLDREAGRSGGQVVETTALGIGLLMVCAACWGSYSPFAKILLRGRKPFVVSALVFWVATLVSFGAMLKWGDIGWISNAPAVPVAVMILSGPTLMGMSETLYFVSVRRLGLAPSMSGSLLVPFFTLLYAWPLLGETPSKPVIGFGLVLMTGMGLIVYARTRLLAADATEINAPLTTHEAAAAVSGRLKIEEV